MSPSSMPPRLCAHVRACRVGDQLIFLDLRRSQYVGVGGPQVHALSEALLGPPMPGEAAGSSRHAVPDEWVQRLCRQRLLSAPTDGEPARPSPQLPEPATGVDADDEVGPAGLRLRDLLRLWRATLVTTTWMRRLSLDDIARRVASLRMRHSPRADGGTAAATRAAAAAYLHLRPFALTSHDRCLNDSLALLHFLATQGLFARWVIGVRIHPFGAHSWVQRDEVVLNDLPERVRRYQPILIV